MIPNNQIPTLSDSVQDGSTNDSMGDISRTKAKAALNLLIKNFLNSPDKYARLVDAKDPLPEELPDILMLLAEACTQLTRLDSTKQNSVISAKQISSTARILRQILHSPRLVTIELSA